jgi:hypothetical protein
MMLNDGIINEQGILRIYKEVVVAKFKLISELTHGFLNSEMSSRVPYIGRQAG